MKLHDVLNSLSHRAPNADQIPRIEKLREAAKVFAVQMYAVCAGDTTGESADLDHAQRLLLDSTMWAVKSIVMEPRDGDGEKGTLVGAISGLPGPPGPPGFLAHNLHCDWLDVDPAIGRATKPCNCGAVKGTVKTTPLG